MMISPISIFSSETWCSSTDPLPPQKFDEMMPPLKPEICHPHLKLCSSVPENKVIPTGNYSIPTYSKYPCSASSWLFFFQGDPTCSKAQNLFSMFNFLGGWIRDAAPKTRQFEDPQNWDCDILRAIKLLLQGIEASVVAAVGQLVSCWWWVLDGLDGRFKQKNTVQNSMSFIHGSSDLPPTHGKWIVTWGEMGAATYKSYK